MLAQDHLCFTGMSFRGSTEQDRWAVITAYNKLKIKNPDVSPTKVYNHMRFNGHPRIAKTLVKQPIKRFQTTSKVCDTPRIVKKKQNHFAKTWMPGEEIIPMPGEQSLEGY